MTTAMLSGPEFGALFASFQESAFRLETLDRYAVDSEVEPLKAFRRGDPPPVDSNKEWADLVTANVSAGKSMRRVHVITEPMSDYIRFEAEWCYPASSAAGEQIGVVGRRAASAAKLHSDDFWLFDDTTVVRMHYDQAGRFKGGELITAPARVARYRQIRDAALALSVPLDRYMSERDTPSQRGVE